MKRIAMFLVMIKLCLIVSPAASASTDQSYEIFDILSEEAFVSLFAPDLDLTDEGASTLEEMVNISYSYNFEVRADNPMKSNVVLEFDMQVGTASHHFCLEGTVDQYQVSWGAVLWEGPVFGNMVINGLRCSFSASFSKFDGKQDAQVSVTVRPEVGGTCSDPISFVFGSVVLSVDVMENLRSGNNETTEVMSNIDEITLSQGAENVANSVNASFDLVPNSTQLSMYNQMPGYEHLLAYAHVGKAYYDDEVAQIAISVRTNADKLYQDYVTRYPTWSGYYLQYTGVRNVRIELLWYEYAFSRNLTYIAQMQHFDQDDYINSGSSVYLMAFFEDAMEILEIGSATLTAIFGEGVNGTLKGELLCGCSMDKAYVDITFGRDDYANFDLADPGLAIIFQIGTSSSNDNVTGTYKYQNSITYQTVIYSYTDTGVRLATVLYDETPDTSYIFNITMP